MSIKCSGFVWTASSKHSDKKKNEWLPATIEVSPSSNKLNITVHMNDQIYETIDGEERKTEYPLEIYKSCLKISSHEAQEGATEVFTAAAQRGPNYHLILQKHLLLKGNQLKIGFDDLNSQELFHNRIKEGIKSSRRKPEKKRRRLRRLKEKTERKKNFDEIANFMTENEIYEAHTTGTIKVHVVPTDLSSQLKIYGTYLLEIKELDVILMDYITLQPIYNWSFKTVRSFGYNCGKFYILTGSKSIGGCGLLIFESEKGDLLMSHLLNLMRKVAAEHEPRITNSLATHNSNLTPDECLSPPQSAPPNSESHQDLSSSLQDFCLSHCCNFNLPLRKGRRADEVQGELDGPHEADVNCNGNTDDVSLGEMEAANASATDGDLTSLEAEFSQRLSLTDETKVNKEKLAEVELAPVINPEPMAELIVKAREENTNSDIAPKDTQKRGFRAQSLKKCLHDFFGHSSSVLDSHRQCSSLTVLDSPTSLNNTRQPPKTSALLTSEGKSHSFTENRSLEVPNRDLPENRVTYPKHSTSNKAVQLVKWRDLSGRNECSSSQKYLISPSSTDSDSSDSEAGSNYLGSDIVKYIVKKQEHEMEMKNEDGEEGSGSNSLSIQSAPTMKRPTSNFTSELIASTAF